MTLKMHMLCAVWPYGLAVTICISSAAAYAESSSLPPGLSFRDFVKAAISSNETGRINETQKLLYEAKKVQSVASLMPQVKMIGSGAKQDNSKTARLNATTSALKVSVTQPLLGLYKNRAAIDYAEQQIQAVSFSGDDSILQLELALSDAYHAVLSAVGDVESYLEVRASANKRVAETAARVKIGRSRIADLYSAQAQQATIEAQLEQTKIAESGARSTLAQISGLPANSPVVDSIELPAGAGAIEGFIGATDSLPSVKYLVAQKSATESLTEVARAQRIPDLDLLANYYLHRDLPLDKVRCDVGLQLTWFIYDGGLISGKVRESQSQYQMYDEQLSQKRRVTEIKIRQYYEQFNASLRQIPIFKKSLALSQKSYDSLDKDYRLGLATILDLIQSNNAVADAKRQYNHQIINAKATLVALRLNAGQKI